MLVTLCVSSIPRLAAGPGSGSLGRHLRLPSSLRWEFQLLVRTLPKKVTNTLLWYQNTSGLDREEPHTDTGQRSATNLAMAGNTHGMGDTFPDILHPTTVPLETPGKPFPSQAMQRLDGNAPKCCLSLVQGFLQSHTRSRVVVSCPYLGGLHPLPAPRQQHQSKMGSRTVLDNA